MCAPGELMHPLMRHAKHFGGVPHAQSQAAAAQRLHGHAPRSYRALLFRNGAVADLAVLPNGLHRRGRHSDVVFQARAIRHV